MRRAWLPIVLALASACTRTVWRSQLHQPNARQSVDATAPFLKVHMHDGRLYVLERWRLDEASQSVTGEGLLYNARRVVAAAGAHRVAYNTIALLETNRPESVRLPGVVVLGVVTAATLSVALY